MYRTMVMARLCDEAQFRLNRQGKAPFVVPGLRARGLPDRTAWAIRRGTTSGSPTTGTSASVSSPG